MKLTFLKTLILFVAGFCLFVLFYHQYQVQNIQNAVKEHAKVVAGSIWDLNLKGSEEYLRAVAANNNYEYIVVEDIDGKNFIEVRPSAINAFERDFVRLKLIPRKIVSADIFYRGELIGKVKALWMDKSIYIYAYAFIPALLLFVIVQLYSRILKTKITLEKKVDERTRNLTQKTEELQKSESKIRAIFDQTLQFIGLLDADGIFLEANQAVLQTWGPQTSDAIGKPFWEAPWFSRPPGLKERIKQCVAAAARGNLVRQEIEHSGPDGNPLYVDFSLKPILDGNGTVVFMIPEGRDITELRAAQKELQYSEELHRIIIGSISDPVFITDNNRNFTYIGANVSQRLGYSVQEIQAMGNIKALVGRRLFRLEDLKRTGEIRNIESTITGKDGAKHFFLTNIKYVSIKNGTILFTFHEISELKNAYDAQAESEKSYRTLAENLPGLVYRLFFKGNNRIQFFNNMLAPMTGYGEAELTGDFICPLALKILPEDRERILAVIQKAIAEKKPFDVEYAFLHKSEGIKYFHERGRPMFDESGSPLYIDGVIFDITENKESLNKQQELETQLRQAQKLEALGALAGGITHDFNNILASIYGYSQLALLEVPDDSKVRIYLKDMHDAANRARELVKQILTFSRQEAQTQSPVEVGIIVKEALKLLRASIPATIEIRRNIERNCGSVMANPTQIHQILMNLCTNAYHAMRETGGILSVFLTPENMTGGEVINGIAFTAGPYLHLEVADTGHGMDAEMIDRIFEPYFTTKSRGEGTGMGLSVVHGIVKSHGAHITVNSEPGKGSSFHIYWPVIDQSAAPEESEFTQSLPEGIETIMLLDDEEPTLLVEEAILKRLGYRVHSFSNPHLALAGFREKAGMFDLVVTDMTMPDMTGVDLFKALKEIRPDIPVILCTGYSEIISRKEAQKMGISAFMMKPIQIRKFASELRKLLDGEGKKE